MNKTFENKKLNKEDHAKVDKTAKIARGVIKSGGLAIIGLTIKKVPWKRVGKTISKAVFKG